MSKDSTISKKGLNIIVISSILAFLLLSSASAELRGYDAKNKTWQYINLGTYPTHADGSTAPILWRLLNVEDNVAYAISENILEAKQLHHTYDPYPGWLESDLFAYLNQDFARRAFTETELSCLVKNPDGGIVTLPEVEDIRNADYGFPDDKSRECQSTAYADTTGLYYYHRNAYYYHPFWTRTASEVRLFAQRCTKLNGKIGYLAVTAKDLGVRPVISIGLNLVTINGNGTMADPFTFSDKKNDPSSPTQISTNDAEYETDTKILPQTGDEINTQTPNSNTEEGVSVSRTNASINIDPRFPQLTDKGFLQLGVPEFVYMDPDNGVWLYCSQTLRIEINRHFDASQPLRWLVAHIFTKEDENIFHMVANDPDHMTTDASKYLSKPADIAINNNLVFAMNGDYFLYRVGRKKQLKSYTIGIEIRNNVVLFDNPAKASRKQYPNLDLLALYADGDMRVFNNDEITSQELVDQGAVDVLSFGPYLIRDNLINTSYLDLKIGSTLQPRTAIGMVEKGHYVSMVVEGRIPQSIGATCSTLGSMMDEQGCSVAFNLDGGWTSAMIFMGKQLNQLGIYNGSSNAREQNEVLGIGYTQKFDQYINRD